MRRTTCVIVLLSLLMPAAHAGAQTNTHASPEYWFAFASKLPIGSIVGIRTADGRRQTGVLTLVEQDALTLQPRTRIPEPPRRVRFEHLAQLEPKRDGPGLGKAVAIGVAAGAGTFFGILMLMLAAFSD